MQHLVAHDVAPETCVSRENDPVATRAPPAGDRSRFVLDSPDARHLIPGDGVQAAGEAGALLRECPPSLVDRRRVETLGARRKRRRGPVAPQRQGHNREESQSHVLITAGRRGERDEAVVGCYFIAPSGSTALARTAGSHAAAMATTISSTVTLARVTGSVTLTSTNMARRSRVVASDTTRPTAAPIRAVRSPSPRIWRATTDGVAPSAIRKPISNSRWVTEYAITP